MRPSLSSARSHCAGAGGVFACGRRGGGRCCTGLPAAPAPHQPLVRLAAGGLAMVAAVPGHAHPLLLACRKRFWTALEGVRILQVPPAAHLKPRQLLTSATRFPVLFDPILCSDFEFLERELLERELGPAGLPPLLLNKFLQLGKRAAAAAAAAGGGTAQAAAAAAGGASQAGARAAAAGAAGGDAAGAPAVAAAATPAEVVAAAAGMAGGGAAPAGGTDGAAATHI